MDGSDSSETPNLKKKNWERKLFYRLTFALMGDPFTDVMAAIAQIEAEGEAAGNHRGGGNGNNGRSCFFDRFGFHRQSSVTQYQTPGLCLLILSC